uniref:TLDc domain-containing protein n=1 Tax=Panagrolaimus sp. PS1159 TaxID=55785 RepID=A0AC35GK73_9BILA
MGNVLERHHKYQRNDELQESMRKKCFWSLSNGEDIIKLHTLKEKLNFELGEPIYNYLSDNESVQVNLEEFCKKGLPLLGNSTDIYIKIIQPFEKLLEICFDCANVKTTDKDAEFIKAFIKNMKSDGDDVESIARRKNLVCPGLFFSIQSRIFDIFYDRKHIDYDFSSNVLTPAQMYILYGMLPVTIYFCRSKTKPDGFSGKEWDLLWTANNPKEITPDIFQKQVFNFEGPTVTIIKTKDDEIFAIANDQKWINSRNKIGGNYSSFIKILPEIRRFDGGDMLYCNFAYDSNIEGIMWGAEFLVQNDMRNVKNIEVWGCGIPMKFDQRELDELQRQSMGEKKSEEPRVPRTKGEFNAKPSGGDEWDVDKQLLEMAGFEFDRHRRAGPIRPPDADDD